MQKNHDCPSYNRNTEIVRQIIGHTSDRGAIWSEKELTVSEYCSIKNSYDFDCTNCPIYAAVKEGKKIGKNDIW